MEANIIFEGKIDLVAVYAALLSTAITIWEFIKWRHRNRIDLHCTPNMIIVPSSNPGQKYINFVVTNKGDKPTTLTHVLGYYWPTWFDKLRNNERKAFIVKCDKVPCIVNPGERWSYQAIQDKYIEKLAQDGLLYLGVSHSMAKKEVLRRIFIEKKGKNGQD